MKEIRKFLIISIIFHLILIEVLGKILTKSFPYFLLKSGKESIIKIKYYSPIYYLPNQKTLLRFSLSEKKDLITLRSQLSPSDISISIPSPKIIETLNKTKKLHKKKNIFYEPLINVYKETGEKTPHPVLKGIVIEYPYLSRIYSEEGTVILKIWIEKGKIIKVKIIKSSGHLRLDKAAIEGIKKAQVISPSNSKRYVFFQKIVFKLK